MSGPLNLKKFISPAQIVDALEYVRSSAESETVIAGGVAMQLYGSDRMTMDLDLICVEDPGFRPIRPLSFGGYSTKTPEGTPLDIIIRDDKYDQLYAFAMAESLRMKDLDLPVVSPEYLSAIKLVAGRPKDIEDIKCLIRWKHFRAPLARKIIERNVGSYAAEDFDSLMAEVKIQDHTKRVRIRGRRS